MNLIEDYIKEYGSIDDETYRYLTEGTRRDVRKAMKEYNKDITRAFKDAKNAVKKGDMETYQKSAATVEKLCKAAIEDVNSVPENAIANIVVPYLGCVVAPLIFGVVGTVKQVGAAQGRSIYSKDEEYDSHINGGNLTKAKTIQRLKSIIVKVKSMEAKIK